MKETKKEHWQMTKFIVVAGLLISLFFIALMCAIVGLTKIKMIIIAIGISVIAIIALASTLISIGAGIAEKEDDETNDL